MLTIIRHTSWLLLACVVFASPSYAYLDPGTGSIILQSILASIAVAIGVLRFYWHGFKAFLANVLGSSGRGRNDAGEALDTDSEPQNRP